MPAIEDLLREELKRVTDTVQPETLRPLRVPARPPGRPGAWRLGLLPAAAAAATAVVIVLSVSLAGPAAHPRPAAPTQAPAGVPRFYLTIVGSGNPRTDFDGDVLIHDSATRKSTVGVPVEPAFPPGQVPVITTADDRTFIIAAAQGVGKHREVRLLRLVLSADGRRVSLAMLPEILPVGITGMTLSPDGTRLALSLQGSAAPGTGLLPCGGLEVIDLGTGRIRSWTACQDRSHFAGSPSWVNGDRMIAFTWWQSAPSGAVVALTGIRLLDTAADGASLLHSRLTPVLGGTGTGSLGRLFRHAVITDGGRQAVVAACWDVPARGGHGGTAHAAILRLSEQRGFLHLSFAYGGNTTRYQDAATAAKLNATCNVLSADASGAHYLVQLGRFGWIDTREVFTPLPASAPGVAPGSTLVAAAW